jgi:rhodanese-related sulfurtransferase
MTRVSAKDAMAWKGRFVDVRNLDEYAAEWLEGTACVPLPTLAGAAASWDRSEPILVMCKSGMRSTQAARQLEAAGFTQVHMLEGGIEACKRAGLPVQFNRKKIPLFRQVFIGAGLVLLLGLLLAWQVDSRFLLIDVIVAAGLVFAGFTGFCPMAEMLKRMPWNTDAKAAQSKGACC